MHIFSLFQDVYTGWYAEHTQLAQSKKTPLAHETALAYIEFSQQLNILQPL